MARMLLLTCAAALASGLIPAPAAAAEFPASLLYVADPGDDRLATFGPSGSFAGAGSNGGLLDAGGLAFGPDGRLYVSSSAAGGAVRICVAGGQHVGTLGAAELTAPGALAFGPTGELFVVETDDDSIRVFGSGGLPLGPFPAAVALDGASDLLFGPDGHLFVASAGGGRVLEFDPSGALVAALGDELDLGALGGLALGPGGELYVSSRDQDRVHVFDGDGVHALSFGADTLLSQPGPLTFGPDGLLSVVSGGNSQVVVFDADGAFVRSFGGAQLSAPADLAFAPFRFKFSAKGELLRDGQPPVKLRQTGVLSVQPGSCRLMLTLDPVAGSPSVLTTFGSEALTLTGFESRGGAGVKKRALTGALMTDAASEDGTAALTLSVGGKTSKSGFYEPRKGKGRFVRAQAGAVFTGQAKVGKRLK